MPKQRLQSLKLAFWLLDFLLSFIAVNTAAVLYFYVLVPGKRKDIVFNPDSWYLFSSYFSVEEWGAAAPYVQLALLFSLSQVFIFSHINMYQARYRFSPGKEILTVIRGVFLNLFIILALIFFYRPTSFSRFVILLLSLFTVFFVFLGHRVLWFLAEIFYQNTQRRLRVLILGTGEAAQELSQIFNRHKIYGCTVIGAFGKKPKKNSPLSSVYKGQLLYPHQILKKYKPSLVFYADKHNLKKAEEALHLCDREGIDYCVIPELTGLLSIHSHPHSHLDYIEGIPVLLLRDTPLHSEYNKILKRLFDIVFSSITLIFNLPLFLVIAVILKLESKGSVFFHQERVGLDKKPFWILKFRTMLVQDIKESDTTWGSKRDPRTTRFGSFLRKTSLDELPQFWNVLTGDMSIVGPRPERPFFVRKFKNKYGQYMRRHLVKSGITGWAQVQGLRGDTSIQKRVEADVHYIENWSLGLDILILLKTLPALIRSPGD